MKNLRMDYMLRQLDSLYRSHGMCRPGLLRLGEQLPSSSYYGRQFGSLDHAFQRLFDSERDLAREKVHDQIRSQVPEVVSTMIWGTMTEELDAT